MKEIF
jgi:hypothetical protein